MNELFIFLLVQEPLCMAEANILLLFHTAHPAYYVTGRMLWAR
jgi:hypothetical protein